MFSLFFLRIDPEEEGRDQEKWPECRDGAVIFAEYYHDFRRPVIITGNKIHTKGPGENALNRKEKTRAEDRQIPTDHSSISPLKTYLTGPSSHISVKEPSFMGVNLTLS